jgi:hypothetical protein
MSDCWRTALAFAALLPVCAATLAAQDWREMSISRQLAGEDRLSVEVEFGAGEFSLRPASTGTLFRSRLMYNHERFQPVANYSGDLLKLGLQGGSSLPRRSGNVAGNLDLELSPLVPLDVVLKFGAARADLEMGGLTLRKLEVLTGASETSLRFSEPNRASASDIRIAIGAASFRAVQIANANATRLKVDGGVGDVHLDFTGLWRGDMDAELSMGLGSLALVLPRDLGVRLVRSTFLTSFNPRGLTRREDGYYSANWGQAVHHLTLSIGAAFGAIDITWVEDPRP